MVSESIAKDRWSSCALVASENSHDKRLVVLRINVDLAIFQPYLNLEAGDKQSLKIQVARRGIEPRSSCSASQELKPLGHHCSSHDKRRSFWNETHGIHNYDRRWATIGIGEKWGLISKNKIDFLIPRIRFFDIKNSTFLISKYIFDIKKSRNQKLEVLIEKKIYGIVKWRLHVPFYYSFCVFFYIKNDFLILINWFFLYKKKLIF